MLHIGTTKNPNIFAKRLNSQTNHCSQQKEHLGGKLTATTH